jgi:SpoVK/Ycf46/Vps4 family AAA+-type ATPase
MEGANVDSTRAANLWEAYARKLPPIAKSCRLVSEPELEAGRIGGLEAAKEEILTYACAATHPAVYSNWGTIPPTGLLLIGPEGSGKSLLAEMLATHAGMPFLEVSTPRLVRQLLHAPSVLGELLAGWAETLAEMPPTTVFFGELDFHAPGGAGPLTVPLGSVMDLLLELTDRTEVVKGTLLVGSTSRPDSLPAAFIEPGRFERVVDVVPVFPDDVIAALQIHAAGAEARAGRKLFVDPDWKGLVGSGDSASIGDWIRMLHAALRRKARCEAAGEPAELVTTDDLRGESERSTSARRKIPTGPGSYL